MATLSDRQIAAAAAAAGFQGKDLVTAVAVALAESSGNPNALNPSGAAGLWQILRSAHPELFARYQWNDPNDNARMAYSVWRAAGNSWSPWVAYTTGRHLAYVGRARKAAGNPQAVGGTGFPAAPVGSSSVGAGSTLTEPALWIRVAMFIAGGALLVWALLTLTTVDNSLARLAITRKVLR